MHDRSVPLPFLLLLAGCFRGGQAALISSRARRIAAASRSIASILGCISGVSGKRKGHYGYYGVIFTTTAPWSGSGTSSANCGSWRRGDEVRGRSEPGSGSTGF